MRKAQRSVFPTKDRQKLEETVKAAEDMIALLKQFGVPVDKDTVRSIKAARDYLNNI